MNSTEKSTGRFWTHCVKVIDVKRIAYLLVLAMGVGLGLVYLQTTRMQTVWQLTQMHEAEQRLRQQAWGQQTALSKRMDSPERIKGLVTEMGLVIGPMDETQTAQLERGYGQARGSD